MDNDDLELERLRLQRKKRLLAHQATIQNISYDGINEQSSLTQITIPKGIIHLNDSSFKDFIEHSTLPILIDFWAGWCQPCKIVAPIIEALERKYRNKMIFAKIDIDNNPQIANIFAISSIPTFHIWNRNHLIDQFTGALPGEKFDQKVRSILKSIQ